MRKAWRLALAAMVALVGFAVPALAQDEALRGLWDDVLPLPGTPAVASHCDPGPPPVISLATETRYDLNDKNRTLIDAQRSAVYEAAVAPVRQFAKLVVGYANAYSLSHGRDTQAALCAGHALLAWANAAAMEDAKTDIAQFNRVTFLAAIASAYVQVRASGTMTEEEQAVIKAWFGRLSSLARQFYQRKRDATHVPPNNIQYWAGLGVAMAAVAIGDRDRLDWGLEALHRGVCQATPQGALPAELNRQERALHYHVFALAPLVALAELGERNGIASYDLCGGALQKIVDFTLTAYSDPTQINALAGSAQLPETMDLKPSANIAWLEIYADRFPHFIWADRMNAMRPLISTNLGGRLTQLYRIH